jgi:4-hydroxybenzoate polyprenyltransferase
MRDVLKLIRPHQWAKNVFVLAPLLFSGKTFVAPVAAHGAAAFASFCLVSSAVYVLNDVLDRRADQRHPRKRNRPVASGRVSVPVALVVCVLLLAGGAAVALWLPWSYWLFTGLDVANSLAYCLYPKNKVIADVMGIAIGFVLRVLAGCAAIEVQPSSWIVVCGFSLALVLGFGKRRAEVTQPGGLAEFRPVLLSYDVAKLDTLLAVATAVTLLSYVLYTIAPDTVERHGTSNLMYSVPVVAYGLFRYLFKSQEGAGDGPTEILFRDPVFPLVGILWVAVVALILYWP